MATPPTRVQMVQPAVGFLSTARPKTTPTFDVQSGDLLVCIIQNENGSSTTLPTAPTWTGTGTWVSQSVTASLDGSRPYVAIYSCSVTATATGRTVSVTAPGSGTMFGFTVTQWRNHGGVGVKANAVQNNGQTGAGQIALAGCSANSAVQFGCCDWNAVDGSGRVWLVVNGAAMTETIYARNTTNYGAYGAYRSDVGTAGSKTVGLSAPTTMQYGVAAIEILGVPGGATQTADASQSVTVTQSASLTRGQASDGGLSVTGTQSASATAVKPGAGTLAVTATLAADATVVKAAKPIDASLSVNSVGSAGIQAAKALGYESILSNTDFDVDNNGDGLADSWLAEDTTDTTPVYSITSLRQQRMTYSGDATNSGTQKVEFYQPTPAGSFAEGDSATFEVWLSGSVTGGGYCQIVIEGHNGSTYLDEVNAVVQLTPNLQPYRITHPGMPAGTNLAVVVVMAVELQPSSSVDIIADHALLTKQALPAIVRRTNFISAPSFSLGGSPPTGWSDANSPAVAVSYTYPTAGILHWTSTSVTSGTSNQAQLISNTSDSGTFAQGDSATVSFAVSGSLTGCNLVARIQFMATGGGSAGTADSSAITVTGTPTRVSFTATAPANTNSARVLLRVTALGTADNFSLDIDDVLLENSSSAGSYFDGSTPGFEWTGVEGNSSSRELVVYTPQNTLSVSASLSADAAVTKAAKTLDGTLAVTSVQSAAAAVSKSITGSLALTATGSAVASKAAGNSYRIWPSTDGPATDAADPTAYSMGMAFSVSQDSWVTEIHYWRPNTAVAAVAVGAIFDAITRTQASPNIVFTDPGTTTGWITATLPVPFAVTAGSKYKVVVLFPSNYSATANYWTSGPGTGGLTNGILTALDFNAADGGQDTFIAGSTLAYPNQQFNATNYWIDVTVTGDNPGTDAALIVTSTTSASASVTKSISGSLAVVGTLSAGDVTGTPPKLADAALAATATLSADLTKTGSAVRIIQFKTGAQNTAATTTTVTWDTPATAGSRLYLAIASDATLTGPAGWELKPNSKKVNFIEFDIYTKVASGGETSTSYVNSSAVVSAWVFAEASGVGNFITDASQMAGSTAASYSTPALTPPSGQVFFIAAQATTNATGNQPPGFSNWTNGFTEIGEVATAVTGGVQDGLALAWALINANGTTAYSTTASYPAGVSSSSSYSAIQAWSAGPSTQTATASLAVAAALSADMVVDKPGAFSAGLNVTANRTASLTVTRSASASLAATASITAGAAGGQQNWPDATNTGWKSSPTYTGTLTPYSGPDPLRAADAGTQANPKVFTNVDFGGLTVGVSGDETAWITFKGCRFRSSWNDGWNVAVRGKNIRFEYCTFEPAASQTPPITLAQSYQYGINISGTSSVTAIGCEFYGFGNAFQIETSTQADPVIVRDCYIHDAADQGGSTFHHDGFLSNNGGPQYVVLDHNTIFSGGNTNAIALQSTGAPYSNITITNNRIGGFGYTLNVGDDFATGNTNVTITDNVYWVKDPLARWGPFKNPWPWGAGCTWLRNKFLYGGAGKGADLDGKFWLPVGGDFNGGTAGGGDWSFAHLSALGIAGNTDTDGSTGGGGVEQTANASLSVTASRSASTSVAKPASASLNATATLTAGMTVVKAPKTADASLNVTANSSASARVTKSIVGSLNVTGTLAAGAVIGLAPKLANAALVATASLSADLARTASFDSGLSVTVDSTASLVVAKSADASLAVTASIVAGSGGEGDITSYRLLGGSLVAGRAYRMQDGALV